MIDKEFYKKASLNNTFDLAAVEKALNDIQISSFQYLYEIQLKSTGIRRFDFNMGELLRSERIDYEVSDFSRIWVYNIPENFIAHNKRLEFRESKYYNKYISFNQVISNPDIFSSSFLFFIDGKIYNNAIKIACREDKTVLIFNIKEKADGAGLNINTFKDMQKNKSVATFFMLPNHAGGSYDFNQYSFAKYNNELPLSLFGIDNRLNYIDKFMATITNKGDNVSQMCSIDNTQDSIYFLDRKPELSGFKSFTIDVFNLRHVLKIVQLPRDEEWFDLEIQECPIATQNCLIFDEQDNFLHDVKLELYYPNIYHVSGNRPANTPLKIYVFYYDDTDKKLLEYSNHLEVYYRYVKNVINKYKNNTILNIIKNYMPVECHYTINNYKETVWFDDHFKFKSEYLRQLIVADGNNFRKYLERQCGRPSAFYLNMANIDLDSRIRYNNSDVDEPTWYEEFDEPRYMFIFKNEFRTTYTDILFNIDGINYTPDKHYCTSRYEYVYIPTDLITKESLMEVEKIKAYLREEDVTFANINLAKAFKISKYDDKVKIFHNDIFVTDVETGKYLDKSDYIVMAKLDDEWLDITDDSYYEIKDEYRIKLVNSEYVNKPLKINIKKNYSREIYSINSLEDVFNILTFSFDINKDPRHIRLYKNGRIVPRFLYEVVFASDKNEGMNYIKYEKEKQVGDVFIIECVPYKMKEVYYSRFFDNNKLIDLYGSIDKPLDLKWYDVYLNGRKLSKRNIEIISPCKFILRNVNSSKNLEIVQNDRDDLEWYGFYSPTDIIDKILEKENFIENPGNKDDEKDNNGSDKETEDDLIYDFWKKFLSKFGFINPDWSQIPDNIVKWYNTLFVDPNKVFPINPDYGMKKLVDKQNKGEEASMVHMVINPDIKKTSKQTLSKMRKFLRSF
jgi:hypothetical protein